MQILTAALKPQHKENHLYLEEDVHFLYLKHGTKTIATWNATRVTVDEIWKEADAFVANTIMLAAEDYWKHQRCLAH